MVHLVLSSTKGNQGLRYFPYSGYLGLTPIRVDGVVRTRVDADLKTLPARSLTVSVRCYETRTGRVNTLHSKVLVDYTQVLWTKEDGVEYEQIGNLDFPFRLSIPAKVAGFSTAVFVDYRCMWRVEAVLSHSPMSGLGSRQVRHFELPLVRYDIPPSPPFPPTPVPLLSQETTKPRAPRIRYSVNSPRTPIGPLDLVSIPIHLQPTDSSVSIRSASVIVERRIQLLDCINPQPPSPLPSSNAPLHPSTSSSSLTASKPSTSSTPPSSSSSSFPKSPSTQSYSPTQSYQDHSVRPNTDTEVERGGDSPTSTTATSSDPAASTFSLSSSNPTITPGTVYPHASAASLAQSQFSETAPLIHPNTSSFSPNPSSSQLAHTSGSSFGGSGASVPSSPFASPLSPFPSSSSPATTKLVLNPITGTESSGSFSRDANGVFSKTLTLQWPAAKSHSRWAIGETISSELVCVKYFIRTKIIVTSPSGTETIELTDQELFIVSTNETERQLAAAKYAEAQEAIIDGHSRSKSKSPRRSKADRADVDSIAIPPSPGPGTMLTSANSATGRKTPPSVGKSSSRISTSSSTGSSRRPHTSAGPRDKPTSFTGGAYMRGARETGREDAKDANDTHSGGGSSTKRRSEMLFRSGGSTSVVPPPSSFSRRDSSNEVPSQSRTHTSHSSASSSSKKSSISSANSHSTPSSSSSSTTRFVGGLGLSSGGGSSSKLSSNSFWSTVHSNGSSGSAKASRVKAAPSGSSTSTTASSSSISTNSGSISGRSMGGRRDSNAEIALNDEPSPSSSPSDRHMREWEEELARIEMRSRRSSDLLGFSGKRKRSTGAPKVGAVAQSGHEVRSP